eukprot:gene25435-11095_t
MEHNRRHSASASTSRRTSESSGVAGGTGTPSKLKTCGPEKLLELTEKIFKSFNPAQVTLDTHADNSIQEHQIGNSLDETFIRQVIYGVVRYTKLLGSLLDSFYYYNGGVANRDDRDMYRIFAYLTIFRLEELGFSSFRRLVNAKDPQKLVVFYKYLFDEKKLRDPVRDDWLKVYEKGFVDSTIETVLTWKPEMTEMIHSLEDKVYLNKKKEDEETARLSDSTGGQVAEKTKLSQIKEGPTKEVVTSTTAKEANRKAMDAKYDSAEAFKAKEGPTREELAIIAAKEANRKATEAKYASAGAFKLHTLERPSNLERVKAEVEAAAAEQHTFQIPPPKPVPQAPTAPVKMNAAIPPPKPVSQAPRAPVKINAAAILREDALYRRKQKEEAEALEKYESELRDASTFKVWQDEMMKKDDEARAASIERRRQESEAGREAAIRARERKVEMNLEMGRLVNAEVEENLEVGRLVKAEAKRIEEDLAKEREEDVKKKQAMKETVVEGKAAIALAAEKVAIEKRLTAEDERQKQAAHAKALAEAKLQKMTQKRDIILQLRALDRVPKIKHERQKQAVHAKALAEAELQEMTQKRDIIMQLRALDRVPKIKDERQKQAVHAKALAEAELQEMTQKRDIIMQLRALDRVPKIKLRALDRVPKIKVDSFDPTTTPDHGILEVMSLVELKERLESVKREHTEEEKENMLLHKANNIQRIRMTSSAQAAVRRARTTERRVASADRRIRMTSSAQAAERRARTNERRVASADRGKA